MQLSVDVSAAEVLRGLALGRTQVDYVIANAINDTLKEAQRQEKIRLRRTFHVRKGDFLERQAAVLKPFASAKQKRFTATLSVGIKPRLLLSTFETGGVRTPFKGKNVAVPLTGKAARPNAQASVPQAFTFQGLRLVKAGLTRKGRRRRQSASVTFTSSATSSGKEQFKGRLRTFLLKKSRKAPLGGVFQRVGPGRDDIVMIYSFRHDPGLRAVLHFEKSVETVARWMFPIQLGSQITKAFKFNLGEARNPMTLEQLVNRLIAREGGYVNDKADAGGPTKFGVTQRKLSEFLGRPATVQDVENLSEAVARDLYERDFAAMGLDIAPEETRELLLDLMENHGPGNGTRILQRALGVSVDGVFGRVTRAALAGADGRRLYCSLAAERLRFTGRAISKNLKDDDHDGIPDNTEWAEGWLNRQAAFVEETP